MPIMDDTTTILGGLGVLLGGVIAGLVYGKRRANGNGSSKPRDSGSHATITVQLAYLEKELGELKSETQNADESIHRRLDSLHRTVSGMRRDHEEVARTVAAMEATMRERGPRRANGG